MNKIIIVPFVLILLTIQVFGIFEVEIGKINDQPSRPYDKDTVSISGTFKVIKQDLEHPSCEYTCTAYLKFDGASENFPKIQGDVDTPFVLDNVQITGKDGRFTDKIIVECSRINSLWCFLDKFASNPDDEEVSIYFDWLGDKICNIGKEDCSDSLNEPSCSCNEPEYSCKPNNDRTRDDKGCATYCGNNIVESSYENCNNCPDDVGKCDGRDCSRDEECEGNYCVWGVCASTPYLKKDSKCDETKGENCKNSPDDCSCPYQTYCTPAGKCESTCGDGTCQDYEIGECKLDCDWCGDGTCQSNETCTNCAKDCGQCKTQSTQNDVNDNEELITGKAIAETTVTSNKIKSINKNKILNIVIGSVIVALVLLVIIYFLRKRRIQNEAK